LSFSLVISSLFSLLIFASIALRSCIIFAKWALKRYLRLKSSSKFPSSRPRLQHSLIIGNLFAPLRMFVLEHNLGIVCVEVEFQLSSDTVRVPDIAFIRTDRARGLDPEALIQGAPDLAVEVISPTDLAEDVSRKVHQYLAAGCRAVWVLYPKERRVYIHQPGGPTVTRWAPESLDQPDVLPGFSISIADIFK
jgi:Uma2 family endonuclease